MKGIRITPIYDEPMLCPSKFALICEFISGIVSLIVGIVQQNIVIGVCLTLLFAITFLMTYLAYWLDKDLRKSKECFVEIGQLAEYEDIKEFHSQYQILHDLGNGRYLASQHHKKKLRNKKDTVR